MQYNWDYCTNSINYDSQSGLCGYYQAYGFNSATARATALNSVGVQDTATIGSYSGTIMFGRMFMQTDALFSRGVDGIWGLYGTCQVMLRQKVIFSSLADF